MEVWQYRTLIRLFAARDVKLRFRQTRFGLIWLIVIPLFYAGGYTFLFGSVGRVDVGHHKYAVYAYTGLSLWGAGSIVFARTCNCLLINRELLTQIYFPRLAVPFGTIIAAQADVVISLVLLMVFLAIGGESFTTALLLTPLLMFWACLLGMLLGMIVASLSLRSRDLQSIAPVAVNLGPIITPIAYPPSALPHSLHWLASANPLTSLFDLMRACCLLDPLPSSSSVCLSVGLTLFLLFAASVTFDRAQRSLADVI